MSQAPPIQAAAARETVVAGAPAPGTASATRMMHVKRLLFSRPFVWITAIAAGAGFLYGAATDDVRIAAGVPAAAVLAAVVIAYFMAMRQAALDFYTGFADSHGFSYTPRIELMESTPLLGAGDRRRCEHYMEGPLASELPAAGVGMAQYIFEVAQERNMRRNRTVEVWTPYDFTIAVVELQEAIEEFSGVFLGQRRGLSGRFSGESWLNYDRLRKLELESAELVDRYELHVRQNLDPTRLMELFQPSFQVWLSRLPIPLCFEFSGGVLVVYSHKKIEEAGSLEIMLQATAKIAQRFIAEARKRRGPVHAVPSPPASVPPPDGSAMPPGVTRMPLPQDASVPPPPAPPDLRALPGAPPSAPPPVG